MSGKLLFGGGLQLNSPDDAAQMEFSFAFGVAEILFRDGSTQMSIYQSGQSINFFDYVDCIDRLTVGTGITLIPNTRSIFNSAIDGNNRMIFNLAGAILSLQTVSTQWDLLYGTDFSIQDALSGKDILRSDLTNNDVFIHARSVAVPGGNLQNNEITHSINQAGNLLNFHVKYSDGTFKSATLALL